MNCYIIFHLTSGLLLHYLGKFQCLAVHLYSKVTPLVTVECADDY